MFILLVIVEISGRYISLPVEVIETEDVYITTHYYNNDNYKHLPVGCGVRKPKTINELGKVVFDSYLHVHYSNSIYVMSKIK